VELDNADRKQGKETVMNRTIMHVAIGGIWALFSSPGFSGQNADLPPTLTDQQMEQFLRTGKVTRQRGVSTGITGTSRLTLTDGNLTHDAHLQCIDESKMHFTTPMGTELNFRDSYKYNIAAYRLDRLLKLGLVPVSVERKVGGKTCAVTWWVDDVQMMEKDRYQKKIAPARPEEWNDQMFQVRVFNELVYNTDPNLGNLLILNDWQVRMVDFSRAFRRMHDLRNSQNLVRVDRRVYEGLKKLNGAVLKEALGNYLIPPEVEGILARRDRIVQIFARRIAESSESAVICEMAGH
jgi:hypothetical protein